MRGLTVIGITGLAGAGKDTIAEVCQQWGFIRIGLADEVKRLALILNPWIHSNASYLADMVQSEEDWEHVKRVHPEVREYLQRFATEVVRENFGENTWLQMAFKKIFDLQSKNRQENLKLTPVVIPDIRFANEHAFFSKRATEGGFEFILWRVDRSGLVAGPHVSEQGNLCADLYFQNTSTIQALQGGVQNQLMYLFENPSRRWSHRDALDASVMANPGRG